MRHHGRSLVRAGELLLAPASCPEGFSLSYCSISAENDKAPHIARLQSCRLRVGPSSIFQFLAFMLYLPLSVQWWATSHPQPPFPQAVGHVWKRAVTPEREPKQNETDGVSLKCVRRRVSCVQGEAWLCALKQSYLWGLCSWATKRPRKACSARLV